MRIVYRLWDNELLVKNLHFSPFTPTPVSFETVAGKGLLPGHSLGYESWFQKLWWYENRTILAISFDTGPARDDR